MTGQKDSYRILIYRLHHNHENSEAKVFSKQAFSPSFSLAPGQGNAQLQKANTQVKIQDLHKGMKYPSRESNIPIFMINSEAAFPSLTLAGILAYNMVRGGMTIPAELDQIVLGREDRSLNESLERMIVMASTPVIDADIHPTPDAARVAERLPEPWRRRYLSGNRGPGYLNYWNPNGVHRADAVTEDGERIEGSAAHLASQFFDLYKIEFGILNPENILSIGLSPESDYAAAQASAINDVFIEEWLPADPRFRYSLAVTPNDPELAAQEIHRLGDHPGVVQVLMPSGARIPYGQRIFHPIYAAAVEHGLPVAIHPGTEGVGISGAPTAAGYPSSYLEWHTGLVGSFIAHLISLVTEGVFIKFPELKFVLIEGGVCWLPPLLWRLDKNWRALRQTAPWLDRLPSEIVFEHVYLTTQPMEEPDRPEHLHMMVQMFPADRMLLFSSDFPHWDGDTPDFAARHFPASLRDGVMYKTARTLYRLPAIEHG